jgi:hypothetical protein
MNAGTWAAIAAVLIALVALFYSRRSTDAADRSASAADRSAAAAEEQTKIQRQLRIDSAQPYVWADVRPDDESGFILTLIIGNSGPTIATNVRAKIDPPLPTIEQLKESTVAQARLAEGISSLPPGRILVWELGQGFNLLQEDGPQEHTFTITADGPFGPVPPLTYIVDLADWRGQPARASGNLRQVTKAIEGLAAKISKQK